MEQNNNHPSLNGVHKPDSEFDLRKAINRYVLRYWALYVMGVAVGLSAAYLYLRYAIYEYEIKGKILVEKAEEANVLPAQLLAQNLGMNNQNTKLENMRQMLKTQPVIDGVVRKLKLDVRYFHKGKVKERELYNESPFQLDSFALKSAAYEKEFLVEILNDQSFRFGYDQTSDIYSFDIPFTTPMGTFIISHQDRRFNGRVKGEQFAMRISQPERVMRRYKDKIQITTMGEFSTILEVSLVDQVPQKGEDILNSLVAVLNENKAEDQAKIARNTLDFIDDRLAGLTRELSAVESSVERFKQANELTAEGNPSVGLVLNEVNRQENELSQYQIKQKILESMQEYLRKQETRYNLIPANLTTEDVNLSALITQYNQAILQRQRLLQSTSADHPSVTATEGELSQLRGNIIESIRKLRDNLDIQINQRQGKLATLQSEIRSAPSKERGLLEIQRQQAIKQNLYLFLLQKREETALAKAMEAPEVRVIEPANATLDPVRPQGVLMYALFFILGLALPAGFILIREMFNDTIESRDDIKTLTSIPIAGQIGIARQGSRKLAVASNDNSAIAEMFRLLRTNLRYFVPPDQTPTILVTSTVSAEGKTFVAVNLARALSLADKRTVLLGMDLRNPQLGRYFGEKRQEKGLSNFLIGEASINEIIQAPDEAESFYFIPSGPIPPDPSELLMSDRVAVLFEELKQQFDYIIIDTPPIGLVTDALLLNDYITNSMLVVRYKKTKRDFLRQFNEVVTHGKLRRPALIFNGTRSQAGYAYAYGYYRKRKKGAQLLSTKKEKQTTG